MASVDGLPSGAAGNGLQRPNDMPDHIRWFGACPPSYRLSLCPTALPANTIFSYEAFEDWDSYRRFGVAYSVVDEEISFAQTAQFAFVDGQCRFDQPAGVNDGPSAGLCEAMAYFQLRRTSPVGTVSCSTESTRWGATGAIKSTQFSVAQQLVTAEACLGALDTGTPFGGGPGAGLEANAVFDIVEPCVGAIQRYTVTYSVSVIEAHTNEGGSSGGQGTRRQYDPATLEAPPVSIELLGEVMSYWATPAYCDVAESSLPNGLGSDGIPDDYSVDDEESGYSYGSCLRAADAAGVSVAPEGFDPSVGNVCTEHWIAFLFNPIDESPAAIRLYNRDAEVVQWSIENVREVPKLAAGCLPIESDEIDFLLGGYYGTDALGCDPVLFERSKSGGYVHEGDITG